MKKYDIAIIGGGFAGFAAAIAAAREGASVIIVEKGNCLGGAAMHNLVNPFMPYTVKIDGEEKMISAGIFETVLKKLQNAKGCTAMRRGGFLEEVLKKCKEQRIHTAIDTAGHVPRSYFERIIPYTDMFLYDLKAFDEDVHIKYTGKPNKLILDNLVFLDSCGKDIEIRIPYVPGCNDGEMEKIANFLSQTKNVKSVKILPYHRYAESKYISLGMKSTLQDRLPTEEEINKSKELFTKYNISVY